jgi:hypothetical protein
MTEAASQLSTSRRWAPMVSTATATVCLLRTAAFQDDVLRLLGVHAHVYGRR